MTRIDSAVLLEKITRALLRNPGKKLVGVEYLSLPKAAVAVILRHDSKDGVVVLLVKRRTNEFDPWSGHMAFPGGRTKDSEVQMISTAKRETLEETGIDLNKFEYLGPLDDLLPGNSSVTVTPFVFVTLEEDIPVQMEPREIQDYVWIPLNFFIDRRNMAAYRVHKDGVSRDVESFPYLGKYNVWGMTLRIITDFLSKINERM